MLGPWEKLYMFCKGKNFSLILFLGASVHPIGHGKKHFPRHFNFFEATCAHGTSSPCPYGSLLPPYIGYRGALGEILYLLQMD